MPNLMENCCVCIGNQSGLINILETDTNQTQWISKLNKCVSEVDWNYDYYMCPQCIQQLDIAYTFHSLCLQSDELRKQQGFTVKIEAGEIPDILNIIKDETHINKLNRDSHKVNIKEFVEIKTEELDSKNEDEPDSGTMQLSSSDEEFSSLEEEQTQASHRTMDALPAKSRCLYERAYAELFDWLEKNTVNNKCITENLLLAYFSELSEVQKASSLWSKYSRLRYTLIVNDKIDIKKFSKLLSFLKRKSRGYKAKKSKSFTRQDIIKFLRDAPDEIYLMKKVFLIIGIAGGCRLDELVYLETDNIQDNGSELLITVKENLSKHRSFTVTNNQDSYFPDMLSIYRKYIHLRPSHATHKRVFIQYVKGKCTTHVIGKNTIRKVPSQIAKYLNLPEPSDYTANSLRRTSASLLAPMTF